MPWTIYRYILRDLIKILLISTGVLVLVISFAAAIKPISDGVLGPIAMLKFIGFLSPTMVVFALPFGAAFAGSMVFCRMSAENEIQACRASGIGYATLLLPVFLLGLVLTLGIFLLSNWVIPRFYYLADRELESDITRMLVLQVSRRQAVRLGSRSDFMIYADRASESNNPPTLEDAAFQPYRMIVLEGAVVSRVDPNNGSVRQEGAATRAEIYLYRTSEVSGDKTWATARLFDAMMHNSERNELLRFERLDIPGMELPNPFQQRLQFLSWPQLKALGETPDRFERIGQDKLKLAEAMAIENLIQRIHGLLTPQSANTGGKKPERAGVTLLGVGADAKYFISAPKVTRQANTLLLSATADAPILVERVISDVSSRHMTAESAELHVVPTEGDGEPVVDIKLRRAKVYDPTQSGRGGERESIPLPRMRYPDDVLAPIAKRGMRELINDASTSYKANQSIASIADSIVRGITVLGRQIVGKLHFRAAAALSAMLILLLAAVHSMLRRGSMPLVVFFGSFLMAAASVIVSRTGENIVADLSRPMSAGIAVVWSGNIIVAVAMFWVYWRLSRN